MYNDIFSVILETHKTQEEKMLGESERNRNDNPGYIYIYKQRKRFLGQL